MEIETLLDLSDQVSVYILVFANCSVCNILLIHTYTVYDLEQAKLLVDSITSDTLFLSAI